MQTIQTVVTVKCLDQTLQLINAPRIASGGVNVVRAEFEFCPLWDSLVKTAVFYTDPKVVYHQVLVDDACDVPQEVLAAPGLMHMGVFGVDAEGSIVRPSVTLVLTVEEGAITEATAVSDPTPELYAQVLAEVQKAREAAERATGVDIDLTGAPLEYVALPEDVGSVSEEWVELADITTTEEVNSIFIDKDKDGNPFVCRKIKAQMLLPSELSASAGVWFGASNGIWEDPGFYTNQSIQGIKFHNYAITAYEGLFTEFEASFSTSAHFGEMKCGKWYRIGNGYKGLLKGFYIRRFVDGYTYPVGTRLVVWGVKA